MQNYKEINGNDYVKDSRTTINETMRSIQSMNSGTAFPTTNLFEGMKCYRTDLKKTYTLTDVENNTWVEDAHAELADEATHAASATKLQTPRALNLSGAVTADAASFDGTADATINVKTLDASKLKGTASVSTTGNAATATKLATARTIALSGNATGSTTFDGSGNATINVTVNESAHTATATQVVATAPVGGGLDVIHAIMALDDAMRIRVYGDANNGALEIATGDDGTEPIYARQYKNSSIDKFTTVARTAAILDTNGNTSFPGTVTASSFTGPLNGNAATASKLASPRTISLTGKAAGSTSFDGSANASINVTSVNADTASKLSAARKINITGNATGAANFDGSGDISINTTVNESKHAATATTVNATAPNGGAADLAFGTMAVNDYARIRVYGKDDNGALEIATADGGNEPIYARQYGGAYDWPNGRPGTVTNEAAILDRNGNTKFPKNVTAASFTGPLNGNATSATTAGNVSNKIYYSSDSPSVATDKLFVVKQAHGGDDSVPNNGLIIQSGPTGTNYNGKLYITDNGDDGVWVGGVAAGKEVGWKRLVENWGSWSINASTATKLQTPRIISLTGNASGSATFDGSGNISINTNVNYAGQAAKLAGESGNNYLEINTTTNNWNVLGSNPGVWLKSIRTNASAPPYSIGNFSAAVAFGGSDTKGIITHAYDGPNVKFAGGNGSTAQWKFSIYGGRNNETYDLNNFPTKTGGGASGTWGINITGNADTVDGYHASDILNRITAANTGGIVAASLTENGYVKFANGLILQWGKNGSNNSVAFPIAFSSFAKVVATSTTSDWTWAVPNDLTSFKIRVANTANWLAFGV